MLRALQETSGSQRSLLDGTLLIVANGPQHDGRHRQTPACFARLSFGLAGVVAAGPSFLGAVHPTRSKLSAKVERATFSVRHTCRFQKTIAVLTRRSLQWE